MFINLIVNDNVIFNQFFEIRKFLFTILSSMIIKFVEMIFCDVYTNFIESCRDSRRYFKTLKINSRDCEKLTSLYV